MSSDIHALSGAYAVDALDDAERADFEQHLAGCEACREEVADLQAAAAEIAATVEQPPPPALRASVLAAISDVRPLPPLPRETAETVASEPVEAPVAQVRELRPARRWSRLGLAAAAAVIAVGGTTVVVHPWDRTDESSYSAIDQVIHAGDVQRFAGKVRGGGTVTVYRSVALNQAVVVTAGMAPAPAGHVYQLWLQNEAGAMVGAGLFTGGDEFRQVAEGDAGPATGLGVTLEPAGGSEAPTTNPIALIAMA